MHEKKIEENLMKGNRRDELNRKESQEWKKWRRKIKTKGNEEEKVRKEKITWISSKHDKDGRGKAGKWD